MAVPIGTNVVTSISRQFILPDIADQVYKSNPIWFRLNASNRRVLQGGTQIEVPLMYAALAAGGFYNGFDLLNVTPSDTIKNAAFDWKQAYVPVTVDGLTLLKVDSPIAIANFLNVYFAQARMQLADILGTGVWSDAVTNTKSLDGIVGAVDDSTIAASYGAITRSSNTWWESQKDGATTTITLAAMQALWGLCTFGGRHPTLIVGSQARYNNFWNLNTSLQRYPSAPAGQDEQLNQAGWTNQLFNGAPYVVDSHVPTGNSPGGSPVNGGPFFLNEEFMQLIVSEKTNFTMEDFQTPINQDAMVAKILWAGDLIFNNCQVQGKFTALTA